MERKDVFIIIISLILVSAWFILKPPHTLNYVSFLEFVMLKVLIVASGAFLLARLFIEKHYGRTIIRIPLKNVALLLFAVVFSAVVVQIVFSFMPAQSEARIIAVDDSVFHHVYKKNMETRLASREYNISFRTNSMGLRNVEIGGKKKPRILMLGDSFTAGGGVNGDETFSWLLERKLNGVEVINAGVDSYSPILEYNRLEKELIHLAPDLIILNYDMGDIQDDYYYEQSAEFDGTRIASVKPMNVTKDDFIQSLYKNVKLIYIIKNSVEEIYSGMDNPPVFDYSGDFGDVRFDRMALTRFGTENITKPDLERSMKYILLISDLARKNNATFIVHIYPYGHQVNGYEWKKGRHWYSFKSGVTYPDWVLEKFRLFGAENNIIIINSFAAFREASTPGKKLFFDINGHFNKFGHEVVADFIFSELSKRNLSFVAKGD